VLDRITPLIITYNELPNVERCLERLSWASRIVVVDSHSDDGTVAAVVRHPAVTVHQRPFDSFAEQCNFGLDRVETEWVLSLDADYLCNGLDGEIECLVPEAKVSGYAAAFRYCIGGRPLRGTLYPPRVVLFRTKGARYFQDGHAHRLALDGEVRRLASRIDHDDRKPLSAWLRAQQRYAWAEADKLTASPRAQLGKTDRLRRIPFVVPMLTPVFCLVFKGLALDGLPGLYYTGQRTYAELLLSLRLVELRLAARRARKAAR
jgi:hypothetical protein